MNSSVDHARAIDDGFVHFRRRDILAFPTKSVADPVDEVEIAGLVAPHQIAGAKPGIALRKDITQDFLFGFACVGVTLETATAIVGGSDPADGLADLAPAAANAKPIPRAERRARLPVDLEHRRRKTMRQERWNPNDRARP